MGQGNRGEGGGQARESETGWGHVEGRQVPMVECHCGGHDVIGHDTILETSGRLWLDLDQQVLCGSDLCQRLRQMSQQWSAVRACSVGVRAITDRITQIEPLLQQAHGEPIVDVPAVVQVDGMWLREHTHTETITRDTRQRKRKGKKVVVLVALWLWTDGSGKREILDWHVADGESTAAWEPCVHRLWERGVRPETELPAMIRDGCGE